MEYRREIDGLRAFAVLPVIFFHAGFSTFSGGFVGVDVFFVISGYLITTNIINDLEQSKFSLLNFYERRARRILPALFLVMFISLPFAWHWLLPSELKDFSQSLVATSLFASNILFWLETGYFETASELKPLLHTWSLSVEEQYYVIFPIFLMLFWQFDKRRILIALVLVFVSSLAVAHWSANTKSAAAFYLLHTRAWELLIGVFAAFYLSKINRVQFSRGASEASGFFGVALIVFSVFAYSKETPFPGLYALVPTAGTALVIVFATQQTNIGRFLGKKAFVGIGLMSYSAYLLHQPLFAFAKNYTLDQLSTGQYSLLICLTLALASLSLRYVENPFRKSNVVGRNSIFAMTVIGILFFTSIGLVGHFKKNSTPLSTAIDDWQHPGTLYKTDLSGYFKLDASKPIDILFFGDSHAEQFAPLANEFGALGKNVGFLSGSGCPPIPKLHNAQHQHCLDLFEKLDQVLSLEGKVKVIVIAGCFNCYFINQSRPNPDIGDNNNFYFINGIEKLYFRTGSGHTEAFLEFKNLLSRLSKKARVVVIGDNPSHTSFSPSIILTRQQKGDTSYFRSRYPEFIGGQFIVTTEELRLNEKIKNLISPDFTYVDLVDIVCPEKTCKATNETGKILYKDSHHMRPWYVKEVISPRVINSLH